MPRRCHCQIDPVFSQIYNLLVMKRALLYFALLLTPLSLWSQDLIVPDSADYISKCRCEKSILKYKDHDSRKYHVFYFIDLDKFFILRRERNYFRMVEVDWKHE